MIDKKLIEKTLAKIYNSKQFSSKSDRMFLSYLIDATLIDKNLKETDIAMDIFDRKTNFNPSEDSIVRSHMYLLRKKLETYYLTDGKDDIIHLVIPKGQYKVEFRKIATDKKHKLIKMRRLDVLFFSLIIIFITMSLYFGFRTNSLKHDLQKLDVIDEKSPIWSEFLYSELPTYLVLGDYYVFQEPLHLFGRERFIRDVQINSKEELLAYLSQHPNEKKYIIETPLTYLGMEVPQIVSNISRVFTAHHQKFKIKLGSDLLWQDIQQNNIIFSGSEKTMRDMTHFLKQLRFKVSIFPHNVYYTPNYSDTTAIYSLESYYRYGFHDDYCIVAKFPSSEKTTLMMLISFSSFGKVETVKKLIDPSFIDELKRQNFIEAEMPPYFEILFKVYGVQRSGFNTDILHFHEIDPDVLLSNIRK